MPVDTYFEKIEVLRVAISEDPKINNEAKENIASFISKAQLDSEDLEDPSHRRNIEEQALDLVTQFEASHPTIANVFNDIVGALQAMGI